MNLERRIDLLVKLGNYCLSEEPAWISAQHRAHAENGWFTPEFIQLAVRQIAASFLQKDLLTQWAHKYTLPPENPSPKTIGLTMAGNIPLVGFHDFLSIFITGHRQLIKPSTRDNVLIRHLIAQLESYDPGVSSLVSFAERLNGSDAYIATGSNNSARYFDYYFGKYPHIIRRNRTSVAVLSGQETRQELGKLADDVNLYFGLGCRNVTKLYVPEKYDFLSLLEAFRRYNYLTDLSKYKHNYDYQLTVLILNKKYYMTNESILLVEAPSPFSAISVLNYEYYRPGGDPIPSLDSHPDIQCIVGQGQTRFGMAQQPGLTDYADGVDTLQFLTSL
ncbi:MAG: acyl-CoA reductase [Chitinophagaceae bacterium]|nr:acyl-CoA reductase [Chitinophagaceae bacterium]